MAVFGHPAGCGVGLVDRGRVMRFRRRRVVDVHRDRAGTYHQVTNQALVSREIPQHPTATVEEHEHRQFTFDLGRAHHFEVDRLTVNLDCLVADFHAGQVNLHRRLGTGQHPTGVFRAQLF
ncbi:hypothetical protein D3C76_1242560 [compost metagenome]